MTFGSQLHLLDQHIAEAAAIARIVLYIAETAEPGERDRLRPDAIALLHTLVDRADAATTEIGRMHQAAGACDFSKSHGWKKVARFLFRSTRPER